MMGEKGEVAQSYKSSLFNHSLRVLRVSVVSIYVTAKSRYTK
jgi:hypothetical protein